MQSAKIAKLSPTLRQPNAVRNREGGDGENTPWSGLREGQMGQDEAEVVVGVRGVEGRTGKKRGKVRE